MAETKRNKQILMVRGNNQINVAESRIKHYEAMGYELFKPKQSAGPGKPGSGKPGSSPATIE